MSIKLRYKELKDNRKSLYLDIYIHKKHQYKFLKCHIFSLPRTKEERKHNREVLAFANAKIAELNVELFNNSDIFQVQTTSQQSLLSFILELKNTKTSTESKSSFSSLEHHIKRSLLFNSIEDITIESINKFVQYLLNTIAPNSAKTYYTLFLQFVRFLKSKKYLKNIDLNIVRKIQGVETKRTYLSENEIVLLSKSHCVNENVKKAFLFSCLCGLRFSDINQLQTNNIDYENNHIVLRNKKTSSIQYIPLTESMKVFLNYASNNEFLFTLPDISNVERNLEKWAKVAGIKKKLTFHVARHTFATLLLTKNVDIYTISKLLNHKDLKTTQIYASIIDEKKTNALNTLPIITIPNI